MAQIYQNNKQAISQPHRWVSVTLAADAVFDGTDKVTHTAQWVDIKSPKKRWFWGDGFLIQPSADISELEVIPYGHYDENYKDMTDLAYQSLYGLLAGQWHEARVIKVHNNTGAEITFNIGV